MVTTIRTRSENKFNKIEKYLRSACRRLQRKNNKKIDITTSINPDGYTLTIFGLNESETTTLISRMTKRLKLTHKQQEPLAPDSVEFRHDSAIPASLTALAVPSLAA